MSKIRTLFKKPRYYLTQPMCQFAKRSLAAQGRPAVTTPANSVETLMTAFGNAINCQ
jgi:hypothetical protein